MNNRNRLIINVLVLLVFGGLVIFMLLSRNEKIEENSNTVITTINIENSTTAITTTKKEKVIKSVSCSMEKKELVDFSYSKNYKFGYDESNVVVNSVVEYAFIFSSNEKYNQYKKEQLFTQITDFSDIEEIFDENNLTKKYIIKSEMETRDNMPNSLEEYLSLLENVHGFNNCQVIN